jgi:kynurenine 3-monooxygenase
MNLNQGKLSEPVSKSPLWGVGGLCIIGAGLSGSLLAIRLAQKGFNITVYEKRPDMRLQKMVAGRSINLALSNRGIKALQLIGLEKEMLQLAIPMQGRMIHTVGNDAFTTPYSGRQGEYINSISRGDLNIALLNKAESFSNIKLFFNHECTNVDIENAEATFTFENETVIVKANQIIGTDGAGSALRNSFEKNVDGFTITQDYLAHGYKELNIPAGANGSFKLAKNVLHIWPRGSFMCIALPNVTGDFTVTLFLAKKDAENSFEKLQTKENVEQFFDKYFPNVIENIPDLVEQFFENPVGNLGTVKCAPYDYRDKCLLLGDAAHAIVPFYGQGMNCSFEDVVVLDELIEKYNNDWNTIFEQYNALRKPNCDAIADLAVDNFYEMRDATANPVFQRKRQLETKLEQTYADYFSKYSMVTFRDDMQYLDAMTIGRLQDEYLMKICEKIDDINLLNMEEVFLATKALSTQRSTKEE